MEIMNFEKWIENSKKLKNYYRNLWKLEEHCKELFNQHYTIRITVKLIVVEPYYVWDEGFHIQRDFIYYKINPDKSLNKIDNTRLKKEIIDRLKDKISVEKLLKDVLDNLEPEDFYELYDRAVIRKGKVREEEGCYKLLVGGKRGAPFELMLRD